MRLQQLFSRDLSQVIGSHCGVRNAIATFTWARIILWQVKTVALCSGAGEARADGISHSLE